MHKLCVYIPESQVEIVKNALFDAGAGKLGNYDRCSWQIKGEGQYRPLENSQPFNGEQGIISKEPEYMVEMICEDHVIDSVIDALLKAHPYETPAYALWPIIFKHKTQTSSA